MYMYVGKVINVLKSHLGCGILLAWDQGFQEEWLAVLVDCLLCWKAVGDVLVLSLRCC